MDTDEKEIFEAAAPEVKTVKQKRQESLARARLAAQANRAKKRMEAAASPVVEKKSGTKTFIYRPQDVGDPTEMSMAGILFRANTPVEVADSTCVMQLITETRETPEGEIRSKGREVKVPLYKVLEQNPWFEINGVKPPRPQAGTARVPETADAYRGYAIAWIAASSSAVAMDKRWAAEDNLRRRCGVSSGDLGYIMPFFEARREECADIESRRVA